MVKKRSNQTVHHQSATKFESLLQDMKNYQPVSGTAKILAAFLPIAQKNKTKNKTITNIFNRVNTDCLTISLLNTHIEKKLRLGKQNVKTDVWLGNLCKAVKTKHSPRCFSHI